MRITVSTMRSLCIWRCIVAFLFVMLFTGCAKSPESVTTLPVNLFALDPPAIAVTGIRPIERTQGVAFRWVQGPEATMHLNCKVPQEALLRFTLSNPIAGQTLTVRVNGKPVATFTDLPAQPRLTGVTEYQASFSCLVGENTVTLAFSRYNRQDAASTFAPEDKDPLAGILTRLEISPARP